MTVIYAVKRGRQTGLFTSWSDVYASVHKFPYACYKKFTSQEEAKQYLSSTNPSSSSSSSSHPNDTNESLLIPEIIETCRFCLNETSNSCILQMKTYKRKSETNQYNLIVNDQESKEKHISIPLRIQEKGITYIYLYAIMHYNGLIMAKYTSNSTNHSQQNIQVEYQLDESQYISSILSILKTYLPKKKLYYDTEPNRSIQNLLRILYIQFYMHSLWKDRWRFKYGPTVSTT